MHTAETLDGASFAFTGGGQKVEFSELLPGFDERDRLGVIVRSPCGAVGASALILATVTAFYDLQRQRAGNFEDFFVYPDYFLFHVGGPLGDHKMLDIFPSHKEVVVEDDAEEILRAINDRTVTRLLVEDVEDVEPGEPELDRPTLASTRLRTAIAYSPGGRVAGADLSAAGNEVTEGYVSEVLDQSKEVEADLKEDIRSKRGDLLGSGRPVETYRRLSVDEALARLSRQ